MTSTAEKILSEALELQESDRATLAGLLIESLDDEPDEDWEDAWAVEIQRRAAQLDSGEASTIPWEEVRSRLLERKRGASVT